MPVFGIGAGMQLLNVSQGGNLMLHIPEDMPSALPHKDPLDPDHRHTLRARRRARSWIASTATASCASTACTTWRSTKWRRASK